MNLKRIAKKIAASMFQRGLYPWQAECEVEARSIPLTYAEKNKLIEFVKDELESMREY